VGWDAPKAPYLVTVSLSGHDDTGSEAQPRRADPLPPPQSHSLLREFAVESNFSVESNFFESNFFLTKTEIPAIHIPIDGICFPFASRRAGRGEVVAV
jgi:hypothetical protein